MHCGANPKKGLTAHYVDLVFTESDVVFVGTRFLVPHCECANRLRFPPCDKNTHAHFDCPAHIIQIREDLINMLISHLGCFHLLSCGQRNRCDEAEIGCDRSTKSR